MAVRPFPIVNNLFLNTVIEVGRDGIPLILINSLGSDLRMWDPVLPLLLADEALANRPLVRYDKRGHGLSDCPPSPYAIDDHAGDLAGLIDYLGYDEVDLLGISVGGMIAMNYAARYPEKMRGLILADTAPVIGTKEGWNDRIDALRERGFEEIGPAILQRWFAPGFFEGKPAACRFYKNMLTRTPLEGYIGTCAAIRDADLSESVRSIRARTLVLCGAEDMATPPAACRALAESMPDARFEVIERAAHLPCIEQPAAFTKRISRFLREW